MRIHSAAAGKPGSTPPDERHRGDRAQSFFPLRLVLRPGGESVELDRSDVLLGRHSGADVRLPNLEVSRRHCRFVFTEGTWEVYDLDSLNGVYVNGQRVNRSVLRHRDLLAVGSFRLQVDLSGSLPAETE